MHTYITENYLASHASLALPTSIRKKKHTKYDTKNRNTQLYLKSKPAMHSVQNKKEIPTFLIMQVLNWEQLETRANDWKDMKAM